MHPHATISAVLAALLLAGASTFVLARDLEVRAPEIANSDPHGGLLEALKDGVPVGADPAQQPYELNKGYTFNDAFKASIKAGFDTPMGDDMRLTAAAVETQLALGHLGPSISWGWFTGLDMGVQPTDPNAVKFGPLVKFGSDKLALTVNPKMEHTFGATQDGGVAFAYAAGLKSEITKGVAFGIEAYGPLAHTNPSVAAPGTALPGQRTNPSLYVGVGLTPPQKIDATGSKFSLELGALAGMTETTPDLTGRLKAAITW